MFDSGKFNPVPSYGVPSFSSWNGHRLWCLGNDYEWLGHPPCWKTYMEIWGKSPSALFSGLNQLCHTCLTGSLLSFKRNVTKGRPKACVSDLVCQGYELLRWTRRPFEWDVRRGLGRGWAQFPHIDSIGCRGPKLQWVEKFLVEVGCIRLHLDIKWCI